MTILYPKMRMDSVENWDCTDGLLDPDEDETGPPSSTGPLLPPPLQQQQFNLGLMNIPQIVIMDSPSDALDTSPFLSSGLITSSSPSLSSPHMVNGNTDFIEEANEGEDDNDNQSDDVDDDDNEDFDNAELPLSVPVNGLVNGNASTMRPNNMNGLSNGIGGHGDCNEGHTIEDVAKLTPSSTKTTPESLAGKEASESSDTDDLEVKCPCVSHEGKPMINRVVPFNIDQVLKMMFSDSRFFNDFHLSRKTTDIVHSDWQDQEAGKIRQVTYTIWLNLSMGPKTAQTTETQIMHKCSKPGKMYCIEVDAITTGVPYSDAFFTHHHHCLTKVSNDECRVKVHSQIKYKKSVWGLVKSIIEKNTWSGMDDFFRGLDTALVKEMNINAPNRLPKLKKPKKSRRPSDKLKLIIDNSGALETPDIQQPWRMQSTAGHKDAPRSTGSDILVPLILIVLILLLILNALLYYKLWALEANTNRNVFPSYIIDPELLRTPKSNDDWLRLIHQQEALYQAEATKWREVIDTVVTVLRETEDSLVSLKQNMHPYSFTAKHTTEPQGT